MWYPSPTGVRRVGRVAPSGLRSLMATALARGSVAPTRGLVGIAPSSLSSALILSRASLPALLLLPASPSSLLSSLLSSQAGGNWWVSPCSSFPALRSTVPGWHTAQPTASLLAPPSQSKGALLLGTWTWVLQQLTGLPTGEQLSVPPPQTLQDSQPASLGEHTVLPQRAEKIPPP